ncbi:hypothetical protein AMJ44_10680 [candidate division WOR-1 bacterium DG_54_3]|uniref:Uncharacterized protein n=1 Tax=candidate division WOR-1 bacterium DG_54_3 TaxID=1703775 RepID=A0A0S7XRU1_UNCSA|nr:MAG: hypothetical protein AMJ44_10680 [candidate division WOR-1 bacterium DG_54_3]
MHQSVPRIHPRVDYLKVILWGIRDYIIGSVTQLASPLHHQLQGGLGQYLSRGKGFVLLICGIASMGKSL